MNKISTDEMYKVKQWIVKKPFTLLKSFDWLKTNDVIDIDINSENTWYYLPLLEGLYIEPSTIKNKVDKK